MGSRGLRIGPHRRYDCVYTGGQWSRHWQNERGEGRALSGHKTDRAYRGYAEETMKRALAATRKRHAHLLAQKQIEEQNADETHQHEMRQNVTA